MTRHYGHKLIWSSFAPAPFESGWSLFAKLLLLNGMNANHIAAQISVTNYPIPPRPALNFRTSEWIDFHRFGLALGVEQDRLRSAFLDQMGFPVKSEKDGWQSSPGIKICKECLAKGYHCVLFELAFIHTCPWHRTELERACSTCLRFVMYPSKANRNEVPSAETSEQKTNDFITASSNCGHIQFADSKFGRNHEFGLLELKIIAESCNRFLQWSREVGKNTELSRRLFQYEDHRVDEYWLQKHFAAAESIAGPCPWPIGQGGYSVRSHRWIHSPSNEAAEEEYRAPRKSDWDVIYRSIRRLLFNRYVRQHRTCWNELSDYCRIEALSLDSDTVCPVTLAFAAWRLATEQFINTEAFKIGSLRDHPIRIMRLDHRKVTPSLLTHASLLYAQFFYIWEEVLRLAGSQDFAIHLSGHLHGKDFGIIPNVLDKASEWTVIIPDYQFMERLSFVSCCGRLKNSAWMLSPDPARHWHESDRHVLFKAKHKGFMERASYVYINIG